MFSAKEVLDIAVRLEKNGESVYRRALACVSDPELCSLLEWMAEEEARHAKCFSQMKQDLEKKSENPIADELGHQLLNEMVGNQSFSLESADFSDIDSTEELIEVFVEFERDTLLFYEMLRPFIQDDDTLKHLNMIIEEEERHIEMLKEFTESEVSFALEDILEHVEK